MTENVKKCCLQIQYSWGRIWPSCLIKIAYVLIKIFFDSKILVVVYDNHLYVDTAVENGYVLIAKIA